MRMLIRTQYFVLLCACLPTANSIVRSFHDDDNCTTMPTEWTLRKENVCGRDGVEEGGGYYFHFQCLDDV